MENKPEESLLDKVAAYLRSKHAPAAEHEEQNRETMGEIEGLEKGPEASTDTAKGYCMGGEVKGYAQGGVVDQPFMDQLNAGTVPGLQFNPKAGLPPQTPAPQMAPQTPQMPVNAPNPPSAVPNPYIEQQRAKINRFGPDEQLAVSQNIMKQRHSPLQVGALAGGTLADALMQGVARAGSGGFANQIQSRQDATDKMQIDSLENARKGNMEQVEANQKLDAQDPNSELSKIAQKTWGPLLAQNGFKPEQVAGMPAAIIGALTGQSVEALKAKAEAELAKATYGLNVSKAGEEARHNKEAEGVAKGGLENKNAEDKRQALQETAKHFLLHPINAFRASKELGNDALGTPAASEGPYGAETTKNGKTYVWHADTGKYYLKGE